MAYNRILAERVRNQLSKSSNLIIEEKKMFGGLAFMVNGKMCINVSGDNLMCRFNPAQESEVSNRPGYLKMVMKGRVYKGYCYVQPDGFISEENFEFWINLCLEFNEQAKSSKK